MSFKDMEARANRFLTQSELPSIPPNAPTDKNASHFRFLQKKDKLTSPEKLTTNADALAKSYPDIITKAKEIPNPTLRKDEIVETRLDFIRRVETLKRDAVRGWQNELSKERTRYKNRRNTTDSSLLMRDTLNLQRAQIDAQFLSEKEIIKRIIDAKKEGIYDEDAMRVYGTTSKDAKRLVIELFDEYPPDVNVLVTVSKDDIDAILTSDAGHIPYKTDGAGAWSNLKALELLNDPDAAPVNTTSNIYRARAEVIRKDKERLAEAKRKQDTEDVAKLKEELEAELAEMKKLKGNLQTPSTKKAKKEASE